MISVDLLSCFYFYIRNKLNKGIQISQMNKEIQVIALVAEQRNITLKELYMKGYWNVQNEINQTKKEFWDDD
ncbi:hypothetical protein [Aquibacillus kalidii]|uniref:hypothetical protein n=1 Tax=Aquibacillus kalidii TaxID=2762597 RepID=UPI00164611ED|nr:hypothetical protein [Aquibacillus kalidii]